MARTGFYPGSFDPLTYGHLDIIARASRLVDRLVIAVGVHHGKQAMLPVEQRLTILDKATGSIAEHTGLEISLVTFDDLAVDAARREGAGLILRGLRDASDFDYEVQMGQMNAAMAPDIETVYLTASPATRMIASSLVRQIARMGGDISLFVPEEALEAVKGALEA
jgi:pantetheine-phosphate adenylyltransferase